MGENTIKMVNEARWADGQRVRNRLDDITYDPMRSQEEFVMRLMRENDKSDYGRKYGFEHIRNLDDFKKSLPLTTYDDYAPYISRIMNGERNVLTAYLTENISCLPDGKVIPQSRWGVQVCYDYGFCAGFYIAANYGYLTEGKTLNLLSSRVERRSSGLTVGNLLGRLLVKREFDNERVYAIPLDVADTSDKEEILHLQALYALSQRDISLAICKKYENLLKLLRYIEKTWPRLTEEIESGSCVVEANAVRANAIREIMEDHHIGTQLLTSLWPGLRCVMVYDVDQLSASFELLRTYCGSSVHFIFMGITSSLGIFSTAISLDDPQTVLIPDGMFYEFKPKDAPIGQGRNLLTLDQLEIGRSYELVITTLSGFYRYQTQKTFLVVGRYHDTPTVLIDKD